MFSILPAIRHRRSGQPPSRQTRPLFVFATFALALLQVTLFATSAFAEESPTINHIEEDWKIELGTPDPDNEAPQIIIVCAPTGSIHDTYTVFERHRDISNATRD